MDSRRKFLKVIIAVGAGLGFVTSGKASSLLDPTEKIKMLTPDGKIVEIEKSGLKHASKAPVATNQEVKDWMKTNKTNS